MVVRIHKELKRTLIAVWMQFYECVLCSGDGLGGKDSAGYITYLFDTGMQGQYGVTSNDFFGLALNEYLYVTNQTYDSTQIVYHEILVDLGLNQVGYPKAR